MTKTNERELRSLERRLRELDIINEVARALNTSADLATALEVALERVGALFALPTGWVWLLGEESGEPYLAAARNLPPALAENPSRMEGHCWCLDSYRAGQLKDAANINVISCSRLRNLPEGTGGLHCHASVPLYVRGEKLGMLNLVSADWRELDADDLRLLHTIGEMVSTAVERARLYARSLALGAVEERNRLAREIHDTLGQGLTAVLLQLEAVDAHLDTGESERGRQGVQRAMALARENLEETRRSVLDLRAAPLEGRSLGEALDELAERCRGEGQLLVAVERVGDGQPLPPRLEAGLFRIAQEALNNASQHANAREVHIALTCQPRQVSLTIVDDGCGFAPDQVDADRFGLRGLNERARLLGGAMELQSHVGVGTRLSVVVPLEKTNER